MAQTAVTKNKGLDIFDTIFNSNLVAAKQDNYPPTNFKIFPDGTHVLEFALAGWDPKNIKLSTEGQFLLIEGFIEPTKPNPDIMVVEHGIANRGWKRSYRMSQNVDVHSIDCTFERGILRISLKTKTPVKEDLKLTIREIK
jgi:HSP20 family molecular chaperone IbpA